MRKAIDVDEMPEEIDFSNAVRGKYAGRVAEGATMVLLEPEMTKAFPDSESVNAALRMVLQAGLLSAGQPAGRAVRRRRSSK